MKNSKHIVIILIALLIISVTPMVTAATQSEINDALEESQENQEQLQVEIDYTQTTMEGIESEIEKVDEEMSRITTRIATIDDELDALDQEIEQKEEELAIAEEERQQQQEDLEDRIRVMYMFGGESYLEMLFTSENFSDFFANIENMKYIVSSDQEALAKLEEIEQDIANKKAEIESTQQQTEVLKTEQETELANQEALKAEKDAYLAENQALLDEYEAQMEAEEATTAELQSELASILASSNDSATYINTTGWVYPFTTNYSITSYFGWRTHPVYGTTAFHEGIDIGAPSGTPVLSMGTGTVIKAGVYGGYGNLVVVDLGLDANGNRIAAYYGHLSSISVSEGDIVTAGQVVGAVGSTGVSTGPHLHFGVMQNDSFVDPLIYF
jgi:murein DD-endopeptidase MepM/ murein hydrolase activator NlpD